MAAFLVDDGALLVHHVVVFKQALADAEVVLLYLALRAFDAAVDHGRLNHFAVLESQLVHDACDAFGGKESHQVVFERNEEDR